MTNSARIIDQSKNLTKIEPEHIDRMQRQTFYGQADWARGPRTCKDCVYWDDLGRKRSPHERACRKYFEMMSVIGRRVPADAPACRFFSAQMVHANRCGH